MAPMHSGFLEEYPLIRVDNFTGTLPRLPIDLPSNARYDLPKGATQFSSPHISFLSHPHTDHLAGLGSFTRQSAPIYCSKITKQLLLSLERKADRERFDAGLSNKKRPYQKRPYQNLRRSQKECQILERQTGTSRMTGWDLLHALPFNEPVVLTYTALMSIRVTLLPANHMPGSSMILIEGERGAILHTGDMRAEDHFIEHLLTKTYLGRLPLQHSKLPISPIVKQGEARHDSSSSQEKRDTFQSLSRLVNIYIDTERLLDVKNPLSKSAAVYDVLQILRLFPRHFRVHIEYWTSGYEEFLLSLANVFTASESGRIHVDRYKMGLMQIMALDTIFETLPKICSTDKSQCQRFCACDNPICIEQSEVTIEPSEGMDESCWKIAKQDLIEAITKARAGTDDWPRRIPLPLQRHSPLPEIFSMIKQLKPRKITANTASCQARFIFAKISERLNLSGSDGEQERQRLLMGSKGKCDDVEWKECCRAWDLSVNIYATSVDDDDDGQSFYDRVGRFRQALQDLSKISTSHRIELEKMDADEGLAVSNVDLGIPKSNIAGPWSAQGRYAAAGSSPFLTSAMQDTTTQSGQVMRSLVDEDDDEKENSASLCKSECILSVELASRYLAYASMFLGWKIRNPSRYHPPMAWKAIRKMNPELARQSEDALLKELGLQIPPWDEDTAKGIETSSANEMEMISVPKTPPLRATTRSNTPKTPPPGQNAFQESISPLQIAEGAADLLRRLDREAASQELLKNTGGEDEGKFTLIQSNSESSMNQAELHSIEDLKSLESQLRKGSLSSHPKDCLCQGKQLYKQILSEWRQLNHDLIDTNRFIHQLNLVGAAARSQRGRQLLSWGDVDFQEAYNILLCIYSKKNPSKKSSLPIRGRAVLHFIRKALYKSNITRTKSLRYPVL